MKNQHGLVEPGPTAAMPDISVVLPSYRAADTALRSVREIARVLTQSGRTWEIVVVDDGGRDFVDWPESAHEHVRLVILPKNLGKGAAVRAGMLSATGRVRIYTDVDLPYGAPLILVIADYVLRRGFHLVVGDRTLYGAEYAMRVGWRRRLASSLFSLFVGKLVTGGFFDTQCGLKGMRADVADLIFNCARINRFAFDVEILYLALIARLDVKRIPVRLINNESSSIRIGRDSAQMLFDVFRMKALRAAGRYRTAALEQIVNRDFSLVWARVDSRANRRSRPETNRTQDTSASIAGGTK